MMKKSLCYSAITLAITFVIGQVLLFLFPEGNSIGSSILFILMNLTPMFVAIAFAKSDGQKAVLKDMFLQRESIYPYILAIGSVCVYWGVSFIMGNVLLTGGTIISVLVYMPWTILQGGLEECGWRWHLQPKLNIKSYILKMFLISIVWFLWHIPIYRLPWITAGSSNYLIFYLMILGNTFMFGAVKEYSKGVLPCVIAHILIDSIAAAMLVGSNIVKIGILVVFEMAISIFCVKLKKENNSKIRRRKSNICKLL